MGVCLQKPPKINKVIKTSQNNKRSDSINQQNSCQDNTRLYFSELQENFPDLPEWPGEIYKGFGIKRMKAYKCSLNIDELNKLRENFWRSRVLNRDKWQYLHQACIYDHIKAEEYLYKKGFTTLEGCINHCVDQEGNVYSIPNYCINDPYFEYQILPVDDDTEKHNNTQLKIEILNLYKNEQNIFTGKESTTGKELKEMYSEHNNIDLNKNKIRFIFAGALIKDDDMLYQHKISNGFVIQVIVNQIEPDPETEQSQVHIEEAEKHP